MTEELHRSFNDEINRYKNALLYYARKCDWDTFKLKAGRLFDYCESIEMSETERRFLRTFGFSLAALFLGVVFIFKIHLLSCPELAKLKEFLILSAMGGCCFELCFFLNFRTYMHNKNVLYRKRRERFIRNIEEDFKNIILPSKT